MADRALVTKYEFDSYGDPVSLYVKAHVTYCRDDMAGPNDRVLPVAISASDSAEDVADAVVAAIQADSVGEQYDFSSPGSIFLPTYTKV